MEYKLFLDDLRTPDNTFGMTQNPIYKSQWVVVRNYDEFVKCINKLGMPELISFDHDLADIHYDMQDIITEDDYDIMTEKTGYHCAKWLIDYCMDNKVSPPNYLVHSMNTVGASNIRYLIENYKRFLKSQK